MKADAKIRISKAVESWYIHEPLLFGIWTTHTAVINSHIQTMRSGRGLIEYNPAFIACLDKKQLYDILRFEALRILLKHPYARRKEIPSIAYQASNIAIREHVNFCLDFPSAFDVFHSHQYDHKHFEFYYQKLVELAEKQPSQNKSEGESGNPAGSPDPPAAPEQRSSGGQDAAESGNDHEAKEGSGKPEDYADHDLTGTENTRTWEADEYQTSRINEKIEGAMNSAALNAWGTLPRYIVELVIAGLSPKLDYRNLLKSFRASILSSKRRLTRMKPSRRYEFQYMGSCREFTTRLLFAVDVSGSVSNKDLQNACAIIMRLFKYGIERVDVIQFDTEIKGEVLSLKQAARSLKVLGRGGTSFQPVMNYIDENREYDGLIIFTDGMAPVPQPSQNRKTRIFWLFNNENNYESQKHSLCQWHKAAFLKGH